MYYRSSWIVVCDFELLLSFAVESFLFLPRVLHDLVEAFAINVGLELHPHGEWGGDLNVGDLLKVFLSAAAEK